MSRESEIDKMDKLVKNWEDMVSQNGSRNCVSLVEYLFDNEIGTNQIENKSNQRLTRRQMNKLRTCGNCKFRDYGTDTHYVCHNKSVLKNAETKVYRVTYGKCSPMCYHHKFKKETNDE